MELDDWDFVEEWCRKFGCINGLYYDEPSGKIYRLKKILVGGEVLVLRYAEVLKEGPRKDFDIGRLARLIINYFGSFDKKDPYRVIYKAKFQATAHGESIVKRILASPDVGIRAYQVDNNYWAFRNGRFRKQVPSDNSSFVPWERLVERLPLCAHFLDAEVPLKENETNLVVIDWSAISKGHPLIDKVFHDQELTPDIYRIIKAMIGRYQTSLGQFDRWSVALFLYGVTGTGKSLVMDIAAAG